MFIHFIFLIPTPDFPYFYFLLGGNLGSLLYGDVSVMCPIRTYIMITRPCNEHPLTPHFYYSKTGVYRGIHYFLIFALKHRSWILI